MGLSSFLLPLVSNFRSLNRHENVTIVDIDSACECIKSRRELPIKYQNSTAALPGFWVGRVNGMVDYMILYDKLVGNRNGYLITLRFAEYAAPTLPTHLPLYGEIAFSIFSPSSSELLSSSTIQRM